MQTEINSDMAFGIPGEHANEQPFFADAKTAGAEVEFGTLGGYDSAGNVIPYASGATLAGLIVSPHEHTAKVYPSSTPTLKVPAGITVGIAKAGSWYVKVPEGETWTANASLYITNYALSVTGSGTVAATVLKVVDGTAAIRINL